MNCGCFLECILLLLGSKCRSELMSEFIRNVRMSEWIHETSQFERKVDHKIRVNSGNEWIRPRCEDVRLNSNSLLHPPPLYASFKISYSKTTCVLLLTAKNLSGMRPLKGFLLLFQLVCEKQDSKKIRRKFRLQRKRFFSQIRTKIENPRQPL